MRVTSGSFLYFSSRRMLGLLLPIVKKESLCRCKALEFCFFVNIVPSDVDGSIVESRRTDPGVTHPIVKRG